MVFEVYVNKAVTRARPTRGISPMFVKHLFTKCSCLQHLMGFHSNPAKRLVLPDQLGGKVLKTLNDLLIALAGLW